MKKLHARLALACTVAMLIAPVAACTSTSGGGGGGDASAATSNGSTQGVTDDSIKIGFVATDISQIPSGMTAPDLGDIPGQAKAYADAINDAGGINGRKVELITYQWNALSDPLTDQRAKCLQATEDDKVFAVLGSSMFGDPVLCVTQQHQTPMVLGLGAPQTLVDESDGLLYLTDLSAEKAIAASVGPLADAGAFENKKLAVVLEDSPESQHAIDTGLAAPLEAQGYSLSDQIKIGLSADGLASLTAAVQRLKDAGVDGVFMTINEIFAGFFMQAAEQANYHPQYFLSDLAQGTSPFVAKTAPAAQLATAMGTTWRTTGAKLAGEQPSQFDQDCLATYSKQSGEPTPQQDTDRYQGITATCTLFSVFSQAATNAGKDLTVGSFVKALQGLDNFPLGSGTTGSYGPSKFEAPDEVRVVKFNTSCSCWEPDGGFQPAES